jgi:DNA-binding transcriptional MocR family regulator
VHEVALAAEKVLSECGQAALQYSTKKVAFVPGLAFYADGGGCNTMRLNFSNSDSERIFEGITMLAKVIKEAAS